MELQICERDVYYINDSLLLALDQKSLAILFNFVKTKYTGDIDLQISSKQ